MKRDSMIFYASFHQAAKALEKDSEKAALYDAIFEYALFGKEFELTGTPRAMFMLIKPQLDANIRKYKNGKRPKQKQTGSKTEAPTKQTGSKTEGNDNVNDNVNENENGNEDEKPKKFDFKSSLIDIGVSEKYATEWMEVRRKKKGVNTETAFLAAQREIKKSGKSANDCIKMAVEKSWCGFEAAWMEDKNTTSPTQNQPQTIRSLPSSQDSDPHFRAAALERIKQNQANG